MSLNKWPLARGVVDVRHDLANWTGVEATSTAENSRLFEKCHGHSTMVFHNGFHTNRFAHSVVKTL